MLPLLLLLLQSTEATINASTAKGSLTRIDITSVGRPGEVMERFYLLFVPTSVADAPAVVVDIHSFESTSYIQNSLSGWQQVAEEHGFLVAYPQGGGLPNNLGFNGSPDDSDPGCCGFPAQLVWDDVQFVRDVRRDVIARFGADPSKVFASGFENGSYLCHKLACHFPSEFAAFASTAAGLSVGMAECVPPASSSMWYTHGVRDDVQPIEGAYLHGEEMLSLRSTMDVYMARNGCPPPGEDEEIILRVGETTCYKKNNCKRHALYWCVINAGHFTYLNPDISQAALWWSFFEETAVEARA